MNSQAQPLHQLLSRLRAAATRRDVVRVLVRARAAHHSGELGASDLELVECVAGLLRESLGLPRTAP